MRRLIKLTSLTSQLRKKVFNRVLININLLNASAQDGGVIGSLVDAGDNCKQPRWRTSTNQSP